MNGLLKHSRRFLPGPVPHLQKWPAIIVGIIATAAVIVMNWLNFGQTFTDVYFTGFATMVKSLFPPIFAGNLVAQIYNRTGAVRSISDTMSNALFKEGRSKTRTYVSCILAIVIPTGLLAYCGMNGLVTLIAFYPIALGLMERAGIPKRYVMGLLSFGVYAFALTGPGTAQLVNVLSMQVVGEGPAAGLVGGLVGVVVEIVFGTFVLTLMIKKTLPRDSSSHTAQKTSALPMTSSFPTSSSRSSPCSLSSFSSTS